MSASSVPESAPADASPAAPSPGASPVANAPTPTRGAPWFALCPGKFATILAIGLVLRLTLLARAFAGWPSIAALVWGLGADLGLALAFAAPPWATKRRAAVIFQRVLTGLFFAAFAFWSFVEFFYFDEFGTRADQVVLDYVFYTGEVTGNVFETYPVVPIALGCALFGALTARALARWHAKTLGAHWRPRLGRLAFGALLFALSTAVEPPFADRTTRELAKNGLASLCRAAVTGELDYASHYSTIPDPLARLRDFFAEESGFAGFTDDGVRRRVDTNRPARNLNLVLVLAESLGRELTHTGSSDKPSLSPRFDALTREALLYDNVYATGTRTARALEGALASFPPIPGNAIVRLSHQRPLDSLASVLVARGYQARFVYGGDLGFDNMRDFLKAIGFSGWIEDAGQEHPDAFTTSWGAADEFVLDRALDELRQGKSRGMPTFLTVLTVSNHRPFLFPEGRVANARQKKRAGAALYADFALGRFFDALKAEGFQEDTIVAVIGDHGPRSYTRERMPADAHRVPFLIWGPRDLIQPGQRETVIGSTMDVAPTLLGLIGGVYEAGFFGRDLARVRDGGMAPMQDKQDIGLRLPGGTIVLGFNGQDRWIALDDEDRPLAPAGTASGETRSGQTPPPKTPPVPDARDLAIAIFQSAHALYAGERLTLR